MMAICEICKKRRATQKLEVCDYCYNEIVLEKELQEEQKNDKLQSGD